MTDHCPHLDYRREGDGKSFAAARAYCTVVDEFVQPVRADVCNRRYGLDPSEHCEIYVDDAEHHAGDGEGEPTSTGGDA